MGIDTCKLVLLNVRGIINFLKRRMIFRWCLKKKTDFIFLQETHSKSDTETQWRNEWGGKITLSHGSPNSCKRAILLKKGVERVIHSKILDSQGHYIKTDHSAILLEFCNNVNDIKGPGYWKMNCSLLEDDYINDITVKIPAWLAEGYKELSDNRNIWDWITYNIRINATQHSKRKAKERSDKENTLQNDYAKAKQNVDLDPNSTNVNALNSTKENLELFMKKESTESRFVRRLAGMNMAKEVASISLIWRKGIMLKSTCGD